MINLLGADTAKNILSCVELSQEIPIKISEEKDMQVSQLYSLKPKFHLKALTFLRDKGIFCGEALGHVNCTLCRLKATTETELESEEEQFGEERGEIDKSVDWQRVLKTPYIEGRQWTNTSTSHITMHVIVFCYLI